MYHFAFQLDSCQPRRVTLSLGSEVEAAPALGLRARTLDLNDSCSCTFQPSRSICCSFFPLPFFSLKRPFFPPLLPPLLFLRLSTYGARASFSRPHDRVTVQGRVQRYAMPFFSSLNIDFYSEGELTSRFGPGQSFLNNLSPHYCIHDTQTVFPFKGQGGVSFLICFKMNAFSGSCARNSKKKKKKNCRQWNFSSYLLKESRFSCRAALILHDAGTDTEIHSNR